jgi:multidrug resistance efflux pump
VNARNKVFILLAVIMVASLIYYLVSTPGSKNLVLIGTVDSNQIVVSSQVEGRVAKMLVDEGSRVKQGDLLAVLDPSELQAQAQAAAANITSLQHKVAEMRSTEQATTGSTSSAVSNAQARLQSARAQLLQAEATLQRVESDSRRTIELAKEGVASEQDEVQAETNLKAQQATVQSLKDQVTAAEADLKTAIANTHQAHAARSTVASTLADLANAEEQYKQAEVRLGYTKIYAPVSGTVSVRAALEGEVVNIGTPIVTLIDLSDTWVRVALPETDADHIAFGETLAIQLPGGTQTSGKVFYKAPESDFATQRDVSRRKRDIRTIVLKVRLANPDRSYVPGMTAEVLVTPQQLAGTATESAAAEKP